MAVTELQYLNFINGARHFEPICKVELLDKDEHIISDATFTGRVDSGSLVVQKNNGVRRTCSLTLRNDDGFVSPSTDIFWINQKFALYLGYKINDENYFIKQGIFVADNPIMDVDGSMPLLKVSGYDKWSLLDGSLGGYLDATYYIPSSSNPTTAIATLLALENIGDPKSLVADINTVTTFYEFYKDLGGTHADVIIELANMLSRNVYYDINGNLNFREDIPDDEKPSLHSFNNGSNYQYLGGQQTFDYQNAYNAIKVIGDNINGEIFDALAENRNNASPLAIDIIGYKMKPPIEDSNIYTTELAELRAQYELTLASRLASTVNFNSIPIFHLYPDGIIDVTGQYLGLENERLLINGYTINFGDNPTMSINATRTQELLFDFN